jgi:hypothetical protein
MKTLRATLGFDLSGFFGAVRHSELGYRDRLAVKHGREQRDLIVFIGPCSTHYLAVYGDFPRVCPVIFTMLPRL